MSSNGEEEFYSATSDLDSKNSPDHNSTLEQIVSKLRVDSTKSEQSRSQLNTTSNRGRGITRPTMYGFNRGAGMSSHQSSTNRRGPGFQGTSRNVVSPNQRYSFNPSPNGAFQPYASNRGRSGIRQQSFSRASPSWNNREHNQRREEDDLNSEDSEFDECGINLKEYSPLVQKIISSKYSYSEKMNIIAEEIVILTMNEINHGGYSNFDSLAEDFKNSVYEDGDFIAQYMGFVDFASMCLNAPEIVSLHTWSVVESDENEIEHTNFYPKYISAQNKKLIEERLKGEADRRLKTDEAERHIQRVIDKTFELHPVLPTFEELQFRYRMCETLYNLGGLDRSIGMGEFKIRHREMHNETLNAATIREKYGMRTNHHSTDIERQRLSFEMIIKPNDSRQGLTYKLRHRLDVIKDYHERLWKRITEKQREHEEMIEKYQLSRSENFGELKAEKFEKEDDTSKSTFERLDKPDKKA